MYNSDLEILRVADERHKDLLKAAEQRRRIENSRINRRSKLRLWVGNQLIVLGERMKGEM